MSEHPDTARTVSPDTIRAHCSPGRTLDEAPAIIPPFDAPNARRSMAGLYATEP
ncbi:MAG: hypothetical protein OJF60_000539 [Burkholderiaceae bacterium]|nr:MAG: hypothetical protein OJF60_000539 [Burkholderiaceae bacterium]